MCCSTFANARRKMMGLVFRQAGMWYEVTGEGVRIGGVCVWVGFSVGSVLGIVVNLKKRF